MPNNMGEEVINIKENFFVSQTNTNDCGAACITMILNIKGIKTSLDDIKKILPIDSEGSSLYDIIKVFKKYNVDASGYKNVNVEDLKTPCIVHIINKDGLQHFVVVLKVLKDKVLIADPAFKIMNVKKSDFDKRYTKVALMFEEKKNFYKLFFKNKVIIVKLLLSIFILTVVSLFFSYLLSFTVKLLDKKIDDYVVVMYFILFLLLGFSKNFLKYIKSCLSLKFQILVDKTITIPTIKKLINLPHNFYHTSSPGELISKINDLSFIKEMVFKIVEVLCVDIVLIVSSLILVCFLNIYFLPINILLFLFFYFISKNFIKRHLYDSYELQMENENLNNKIVDTLSSILQIKNLSKEHFFKENIKGIYNNFLSKYSSLFKNYQKKDLIVSLFVTIIIVFLAAFLYFQKQSIALIIFIFSLENIIIDCLYEIFNITPLYADFKNAVLRINDIYKLDNHDSNYNKLDIKNIYFKNLYYKNKNKLILKNISFEINSGEFIIINGPTGSGKSTIFKLLTKQINNINNNIFINGKSIRNISQSELNNSILYVDQKIRLLNLSIKDNIFMGDNIDNKVLDVSLVSYFLKENNIDYNYIIDKTNSNLSGGQISKIAIAQALNSKKNIIIFDETTNAIDEKTERIILKNIKKHYKNKTIILISHRKSNYDLFDKVITIENGMVKKKGVKND